MKPAHKKIVKREFQKWLEDMGYDPEQIPEILKTYIFEAFVGGWGGKARAIKRKKLNGKNQD